MPFLDTLVDLKRAMADFDEEICSFLSPGLKSDEIEAQFESISFPPSQELLELYSWQNGGLAVEVLPGAYFSPIEMGVAHYPHNELYKSAGEPLWNTFSILTDHSDGGFAISSKESGAKIVQRCIHEPWEASFPSINVLFELSLRCYKDGIFSKVDGEIESDWDRYTELEKQYRDTSP